MPQAATLYAAFTAKLDAVLETLTGEGVLPSDANRSAVTVEPPRDASHGDLSTNAAMVLAKQAKANPRALAEQIAAQLLRDPLVAQADIAGPGFINLRLEPLAWLNEIQAIAGLGADYGRSAMGAGSTVNVEYVSANPTGPMHMGHCRGAVVGDALASLLEYAGHKVIREYYVNDAGAQVQVLARSVHMRYREALGEDIGEIPEGLYPGAYLAPTGHRLATHYGSRFLNAPEAEWLDLFRTEAVADMMAMIRADLALLGIAHDVFSSEAELQAAGKPEEAEKWLRQHDLVYDGMLEAPKGKTPEDWEPVELPLFRSTRFGDDQDRPIRKSDGNWTYFGADLAYHFQKAESADALVDIWGRADAGGGAANPVRGQAGADGAIAARWRTGEDVEARGHLRDPGRCGARSGQGRGPFHHAHPQA
jgi:arginyl-tRNA synthetase